MASRGGTLVDGFPQGSGVEDGRPPRQIRHRDLERPRVPSPHEELFDGFASIDLTSIEKGGRREHGASAHAGDDVEVGPRQVVRGGPTFEYAGGEGAVLSASGEQQEVQRSVAFVRDLDLRPPSQRLEQRLSNPPLSSDLALELCRRRRRPAVTRARPHHHRDEERDHQERGARTHDEPTNVNGHVLAPGVRATGLP